MRAILMAAGVGSRISKMITGPKCTLKITTPSGKMMPLVRYNVERLLSRGFNVTIVVGYKKEYIREALQGLDVSFRENPFFRITNSIASLWFARDLLDDDAILMNADVYWTDEIMDKILSSECDIAMLGDKSRADCGDYFFGLNGDLVVRYGKELGRDERDTEYVGFAKISKKYISSFREDLERMIEDEKCGLWWENVLYENHEKRPIHVIDTEGQFWAEVDYFEDYQRILEYGSRYPQNNE